MQYTITCIRYLSFLFPLFPVDDLKATKDVWLVGDEFLHEIHHTLQEWKSDLVPKNKSLPYLYDQYNVHHWYDSPLVPNVHVSRLLNSFLDGLNTIVKLPKYVLMFPDMDIISDADLDYGVMVLLEEQLQWLFNQINKAIHRRHEDLKAKRGGTVSSTKSDLGVFDSKTPRENTATT